MKESTGAISSIYIIMFFIVIMFGFIISTMSYYKSYKINNSIVAAIEDYGGYNSRSIDEIAKRLKSYGYNSKKEISCGVENSATEILVNETSSGRARGYCVSIVDESTNGNFEYYSYKISTYLMFDFGLFSIKFPYKMSARSMTMYNCYGLSCGVGD